MQAAPVKPRVVLYAGTGALSRAVDHIRQGNAPHVIALDTAPPSATTARALPQPLVFTPGLQRMRCGDATLTIGFFEPMTLLKKLAASVDAFHITLDAHLPADAFLFRTLARLSQPGATLAVTPADAFVPGMMTQAGFSAQAQASDPIAGHYRGGVHRHARAAASSDARAIVIGAGLAGTAAAHALAKRGWQVTVFEHHPHPALAASGNLAGVMSPMLSADDSRTARLSRASFYYLHHELRTLGPAVRWDACGVLQLGKTPADEALLERILATRSLPADFAQFVDRDSIARIHGHAAEHGGVWFPQGGWVNPPSLCAARLAAHDHIACHFNHTVTDITRSDGQWQVRTAQGTHAHAPVLVLANSYAAASLAPACQLHFKPARGQVTHLPDAQLPATRHVILRDGYLTPAIDNMRCLGATYEFDTDSLALSRESHAKNLARLPGLLPGCAVPMNEDDLAGRVGIRALTIDRLPLVGALPDTTTPPNRTEPVLHDIPRMPGLFGIVGLGSRGLVWCALAGETLACLITGEPAPIEQDLIDAVDPARFVLRGRREG